VGATVLLLLAEKPTVSLGMLAAGLAVDDYTALSMDWLGG
jgi:hypothetical protein